MIGRLTLACCALAGCARAVDVEPAVLVTLDSITVTSVDSGQPSMMVDGLLTAKTGADQAHLFEHETAGLRLTANTAWPMAEQTVLTIPTHLPGPHAIELHYAGSGTSETLSIPYVEAMQEQVGFDVHTSGTIRFQLSIEELP